MAAIPKVIGSENEYGLYLPVSGGEIRSSLLIGVAEAIIEAGTVDPIIGFRRNLAREEEIRVYLADFPLELIEKISREFTDISGSRERLVEVLRVLGVSGNVLSDGARFYVDCGHPEFSTPECLSARDIVIWEKAGEKIVEFGRKRAEEVLRTRIEVHKDNSDRKGNSFAAHENYLVEPETFNDILTLDRSRSLQLETYLVSRQLFAGSGKIGQEFPLENTRFVSLQRPFQISQRADFISRRIGQDTMVYRPIINARDRAYADRRRFRRLHLILGDANMCEFALFLKFGLTSIVLKMIEDDFISRASSFLSREYLRHPVMDIKLVSRDPDLKETVTLSDGREIRPLEILWEYLRLAKNYLAQVREPNPGEKEVLEKAESCFGALEEINQKPFKLFGYLDWVTKRKLLERARERLNLPWGDKELLEIDYAYHNINPEKGLYLKLLNHGLIQRIVSDEEIERAMIFPPQNTRAFLRGEFIRLFGRYTINASWDFLKFCFGQDITTILLPNPLEGTKDQCQEVFNKSSSPADFVLSLKEVLDFISNREISR